MNNNVFRQKNIDRINSPESLNDYVKVTNPPVWFALTGILILLVGIAVWGMFGQLDTKLIVPVEVQNSKITAYVRETDVEKLQPGMAAKINDVDYEISVIEKKPIKVSEVDEYVLHRGNMENDGWVHPVSLDGSLTDGVYLATIVVEQIKPMSYIFD